MMKKAIFMCYILGGLFLILSNLFAQDNFENCFKNERTKAKTKGATSSEAITQATIAQKKIVILNRAINWRLTA